MYYLWNLYTNCKIDIAANFEAESHVDRSNEDPGIFLKTNIMCICHKYGIKKYHMMSIDELYRELSLEQSDLFFTELLPIGTSNQYLSSKEGIDFISF